MQIDLSDKRLYNEVYIPFIFGVEDTWLLMGGRDSGKSYAVCQKIVYHLLNERYCKVVLARKVGKNIKGAQFSTLVRVIDDWGLSDLFKINISPLEITCKLNGNKVLSFGLDETEKIKSLDSPSLIWIEEATEITEDDYIILDTSIRCSYPDVPLQLIMSFNPCGEEHWLNTEFFPPRNTYEKTNGLFYWVKSTKENAKILHTTYKDNKWCPLKRSLKYENRSEEYRKLYALGLWGGVKKGRIFGNIEYQAEMPPIEDLKYFGFGLDYGTNDPTTLINCGIKGNKIYIEEIFYESDLVTLNASSKHSIEQRFIDHEINKKWPIIAEVEKDRNKDLKNIGYNVIQVSKVRGNMNSSILYGIDILKRYTLVVCGESKNIKAEFRNYTWKMDKDNRPTNMPIDDWNHGIDALRYWAMHFLGKKQHVKIKPSIRGLY